MTDTGLTNRLRQHSHRAGIMVGLSMALAIAIFLGGFVWIYAQVDPYLRDFTGVAATQTAQPTPRPTQAAPAVDATEAPADQGGGGSAETPAPESTSTPQPQPTGTPNAFKPDYQSNSNVQINFRAGPSTDTEVLLVLTPAQPLQYLNEDQPSDNPEVDGPRWMKFRTEDGTEGWIRSIDAEPYQP
ncbi:MAG TPA: SH3 domain-containing protein [Thermomicrobiales bacterium]|nr:SH3 domain-containing protein [Thermomicrobiales bacterium]